MKRLLLSLLSAVAVLGLSSSALAADRFVRVDIYQPQATTEKNLRVEYKVFSTVPTDTFTVELFENAVSKSTQSVTHAYGNSGVFTIAIPAVGTYSYEVIATNHGNGDATSESQTVNIQVSNAPEPAVTIVTVPAATDDTGGNAAAAQPAVAAVAPATNAEEAVTTPTAAKTLEPSVLGAAAQADPDAKKTGLLGSDRVRNSIIGAAAALGLSGVGYWMYRHRHAVTP